MIEKEKQDPFLNPKTIDGFKSGVQLEQERIFLSSLRYPWVRRWAKDRNNEWFPIPKEDFVRLYADYFCDGNIHHARNTIQQPNRWEGIHEDYCGILENKRKQAEWQEKLAAANEASRQSYPSQLLEAMSQPSRRTKELTAFMHTISVLPREAWQFTRKIFGRTIEGFKYELDYWESPTYSQAPRVRLLTEQEILALLEKKLEQLEGKPDSAFRQLLKEINSRSDLGFKLVLCFDIKTETSTLRSFRKGEDLQEF